MTLEALAVTCLLAVSSFLGIQSVPVENRADWRISENWTDQNGFKRFEAASGAMVSECKRFPESTIRFPMVIHGVHTIALDGHTILQSGDPSFKTVRTFYGSPSLPCSQLASGSLLTWRVDSYTSYFARFQFFPLVKASRPIHNVFAESIHVAGVGGALISALFCLVVFLGKVSRTLIVSVSLSCLCGAIYFAGTVAGFLGIELSMLTAHKIADLGAWTAVALIVNALRIEGFLSRRFYNFYAANVIIGSGLIIIGKSGDAIQFGSSLPFFASVMMLSILFWRAIGKFRASRDRTKFLHVLSLLSFVAGSFNEMFVITGLVDSFPVFPLGFLGGTFLFALAVNEKISETYRERDYLRSNLEAEVERKTLELTRKTVELEGAMLTLRSTQAELVQSAKLASLGTLSAGIAHEINNSLNYVNGALQPLEKIIGSSCRPEDKNKIDKLVGVMKEGLSLTLEIIKSLRNYTGLNQAKFNDVKLLSTVNSTLAILRSKIRGKIEVDVQIPDHLAIFGSVVGVGQIFMNLISNSVDAMNDGGRLTITATEIENPRGSQMPKLAEIRIRDTGSGMKPETAQRIFEPFFTTKEVGKGTGLGLHIVRGEIDRHKGEISVESELGKGTCFTIHLPIEDQSGAGMTEATTDPSIKIVRRAA